MSCILLRTAFEAEWIRFVERGGGEDLHDFLLARLFRLLLLFPLVLDLLGNVERAPGARYR